jgi:hypothetical protein
VRRELLTRWGRDLDPERVLPEYPRPQLVRDSYLNLNGWWDYALTPASCPPPSGYDGRILVPFSPEASLSGVGRQLQPDQRLTYRRRLELPDGFVPPGGRVLLHFGAVDQTCVVRLNDTEVGRNAGGYLPFACDLTDTVRPGSNELVVDVRDHSDGHQHASGKQRLRRGGIWYTAQSGIWQTVWVEAVPDPYVERLTLVPLLEEGMVEVTVHAGPSRHAGLAPARVRVANRSVVTPVGRPVRVRVDDVRAWSPDDPHLYDVVVRLGEDRVTSYVGLRSYGVGPDAQGMPRLLLNGEPVVQVGVLDQGYWPDGLLTAPTDEAMVHDIETMKRLGFTMLRKHLKVEPLRWYHHCDRLGMLVWQDFVNGGGRYRTAAVTWPGRYPVRLDDTRRRSLLGRASAPGRALFREESRRTVEHLRGAVSIAVWVVFNEGWGQFDANALSGEVGALDPTRVVDHASGWHDQGGGDLRSRHDYGRRVRLRTRGRGYRRDRRALVLSEYGGRGRRVAGHTYDSGSGFGYGELLDAEALAEWFTAVHADLAAAVPDGLTATVYTQLCDVEDELNGLLTYDREVLKLDEEVVRTALLRLRAAGRVTGPAAGT